MILNLQVSVNTIRDYSHIILILKKQSFKDYHWDVIFIFFLFFISIILSLLKILLN